jgi:hypothetical protein
MHAQPRTRAYAFGPFDGFGFIGQALAGAEGFVIPNPMSAPIRVAAPSTNRLRWGFREGARPRRYTRVMRAREGVSAQRPIPYQKACRAKASQGALRARVSPPLEVGQWDEPLSPAADPPELTVDVLSKELR